MTESIKIDLTEEEETAIVKKYRHNPFNRIYAEGDGLKEKYGKLYDFFQQFLKRLE